MLFLIIIAIALIIAAFFLGYKAGDKTIEFAKWLGGKVVDFAKWLVEKIKALFAKK